MAALPGWYRAMFRWLPESFSAADRAELESMAQAEWDRVAGRGPRARWLVTARLAIDQLAVVARAWAGVARGSRPSWVGLEGWALDVRYAWRGLVRSPSFFSIAVAVIGLGITGTATILTVADVLLVRPPTGVREASRLVTVH